MKTDVYSSQRDRDFLTFVVKVILPSTTESTKIKVDCAEYQGEIGFQWRSQVQGPKLIFQHIVQTECRNTSPFSAIAEARKEAVWFFWETALLRVFDRKNIPITVRARDNICAAAKKIAQSLANHDGLPQGLVLKIEPLSSEAIEGCDWDGARKKIMSHWLTDDKSDPKPDNK